MRTLRSAVTIAAMTGRELVRNPAYLLLVGGGCALVALSPAFGAFHFGEQAKTIADLGLGSALLVAVIVGVLGASRTVSEQVENLSAMVVLSKPVSRTGFLLGQYLGVLWGAALGLSTMGAALMLTLRAARPLREDPAFFPCLVAAVVCALAAAAALRKLGLSWRRALSASAAMGTVALLAALGKSGLIAFLGGRLPGWDWAVWVGLLGAFFQVMVLTGVAVALSTRLSLAASLPVVFALFVLGQLVGRMRGLGSGGAALSVLPPDLGAFQFADAVASHVSLGEAAAGAPVPVGTLLLAALAACLYSAGALLLGAALFRRQDVT